MSAMHSRAQTSTTIHSNRSGINLVSLIVLRKRRDEVLEKSARATLKFECPVLRAFTLRQASKLMVRIPAAPVRLCGRRCRACLLTEHSHRAVVGGLGVLM